MSVTIPPTKIKFLGRLLITISSGLTETDRRVINQSIRHFRTVWWIHSLGNKQQMNHSLFIRTITEDARAVK